MAVVTLLGIEAITTPRLTEKIQQSATTVTEKLTATEDLTEGQGPKKWGSMVMRLRYPSRYVPLPQKPGSGPNPHLSLNTNSSMGHHINRQGTDTLECPCLPCSQRPLCIVLWPGTNLGISAPSVQNYYTEKNICINIWYFEDSNCFEFLKFWFRWKLFYWSKQIIFLT